MRDFYIYILQVNVGFIVFYLLYRILTVKDTFFEVRRFFLLTVLLFTFTYPLIPLGEWLKDKQPLQEMIIDYTEFIAQAVVFPEAPVEEKTFFTLENGLLVLWFAGSMMLFSRFFIQLVAILRLRMIGEVRYIANTRIIVLKNDKAPFSFFGWIFVDPCCYEEKEVQGILIHEKAHAKQGHSWDMLIGEILCIFFWFNPGAWLIRREIRQNLEFLADQGVLSSGYDRRGYQYHLLRLSNPSAATQIINNFNVSQLKKRIMMMNQKKASKMRLIKYAIVLPVTGLLILVSNARTVAEVTQDVVRQVISTAPNAASHVTPVENTFTVRGQVKNEQGEKMAGVAVAAVSDGKIVKAVTTDANGEYFLNITGVKELRFSYPDMAVQNKTVSESDSTVNIVMKKKSKTEAGTQSSKLEEVVVCGILNQNNNTENSLQKENSSIAYSMADEKPQFSNSTWKDASQFITKSIRYPQYAAEQGIQGTVTVSFVVDKDGYVSKANVIKGGDGSLNAEAIRVINSMPKWKPGKKAGKTVSVRCSMPITFNLLQKTNGSMDLEPVKSVLVTRKGEANGEEAVHISTTSVSTDSKEVVVSSGTYSVEGTNAPGQNVSFFVSSKEQAGTNPTSISPALYQGAISQIDMKDQIVILNGKLVEDVKELPQDLSQVEEILLLRKEDTVRKMNKKYGKNASSVLSIKSN